jgi:hypothetical protein
MAAESLAFPHRDSVLGLYSPWQVAIPTAVFQPMPNNGCIEIETLRSFNKTDIHINCFVYFGGSY